MSHYVLSSENIIWDMNMNDLKVFSEAHHRNSELSAMGLDIEGLNWVVRQAHASGGFSTSNDVKGWRLIVTHDKLVRALRERFCGKDWKKEDTENQEGIRNADLGIRIIAANFDELAGNPDPSVMPSNLRPKGRASWRKARCNQTGWLPGFSVPEPEQEELQTWVLGICSDDDGVGAELSLPLDFSANRFTMLAKRIIIRTRDDKAPIKTDNQPASPIEEIDIPISRKG